jgi:hypothetical protein
VSRAAAARSQAFDLGGLLAGVDVDVERYPVLDGLAFGHALEVEPGLDTRGVAGTLSCGGAWTGR